MQTKFNEEKEMWERERAELHRDLEEYSEALRRMQVLSLFCDACLFLHICSLHLVRHGL